VEAGKATMLHRRDPRGSCMSRKGPWTLACAFAFAILERIGIDDLQRSRS
jgi:hypothetical protein